MRLVNIIKFIYIVFLLALGGCASKWVREIPPQMVQSHSAPQAESLSSDRVILLRWPAVIDNLAKKPVIDNLYDYMQRVTGNNMRRVEVYTGVPELLTISSTFYAAELYLAIRRSSPNTIVLLEPTMIRINPLGKIEDFALTDVRVPVDLVVDFSVWSIPRLALIHNDFYLNIRASPKYSSGNCGLLLATAENGPDPINFDKIKCSKISPRDASFSIWRHGNTSGLDNLPHKKANSLPLSPSFTVEHPLLAESNAGPTTATPSPYVTNSRPSSPSDLEKSILHPYIENFGLISVSGLGFIPSIRNDSKSMIEYADVFDKDLSIALTNGEALNKKQQANLALLHKLLAAELSVRAQRDEQVARQIFGGAFGQAFRTSRDQMYVNYGKQMMKMWSTTFLAIGMHGALSGSAVSASAQIGAVNTTVDFFNRELQQQGESFYRQIAPAIDSLDRATFEIGGQTVSVQVADQTALRNKLKDTYKRFKK